MACSLSDHVWSLEEIAMMADDGRQLSTRAKTARSLQKKTEDPVADEHVIKLLEEIRDLQKEHIASYKEAVKNQNEAISLQKGAVRRRKLAILVIVAAVVIMLSFTVFSSHH